MSHTQLEMKIIQFTKIIFRLVKHSTQASTTPIAKLFPTLRDSNPLSNNEDKWTTYTQNLSLQPFVIKAWNQDSYIH